ncbi:hypothetical protein [Selenomonas ruminantium]|uniref:hypothetical protein n=1 Tax=Selenomonas ruminantium TaxID=971 RepID=UPI0026EB48ED|nr:hypothetical protein [Selenomonas ruminantium]
MDKEQMINNMKQHPKRTALLAIILLLLLCHLLSDGGADDYDNPQKAPYGTATMDAVQHERIDNLPQPAIESPVYMVLMSEINLFLGKGDGQLFATVDMPQKLEIFVCKPATYASKVVIKNIFPNKASLGSANGDMDIEVLKPFDDKQNGIFRLSANGKSNDADFWHSIFYDELNIEYADKKQINLKMPERHQWAAIPYPGQIIAEITPEQLIKITYLNADGKEETSVTTKEKAVAFRVALSDTCMSSHVEFYR